MWFPRCKDALIYACGQGFAPNFALVAYSAAPDYNIITITFCCDNLYFHTAYGSEKNLENSGNFFILFCGHCFKILPLNFPIVGVCCITVPLVLILFEGRHSLPRNIWRNSIPSHSPTITPLITPEFELVGIQNFLLHFWTKIIRQEEGFLTAQNLGWGVAIFPCPPATTPLLL